MVLRCLVTVREKGEGGNRADCCMIEIFVNLDPGRKMEDFCPVGFVRMGSSEFGSVRP